VSCVKKKENDIMLAFYRRCVCEDQKLESSCGVFGAAVCSSADCSHSAVCHVHIQE